ncbi:cyclic AMP response element-binding protein A isoform X2 [Scaptodrosophila lebanonensis]|uniref:Cyclic AMP response element-binding protein A isoform X2 n=1 Tax=Drosophila lebanonensis TaxID=7225 RepID=A0A6J2TJH9_DROLE|nr:cyclic AMP response element-binding protein A isoform X2 [Scaptodrosophila lebanonensis]
MESFYDGDLKDIWDSELDPTESLKINCEHDLPDWFMVRDVKDPTVILNDRLISDALLNGTLPIKAEHSYSLNSDGDSLAEPQKSLQAKIDDPPLKKNRSDDVELTSSQTSDTIPAVDRQATSAISRGNLRQDRNNSVATALYHLHLPQHFSGMYDDCNSSVSSTRDGSISPNMGSYVDNPAIKDEPLSPESSCPGSPNSKNDRLQHETTISLNLANLQTEFFFEQKKHAGMLLSESRNTQNLNKSQHRQCLIEDGSQNLLFSHIKSEKKNTGSSPLISNSCSTTMNTHTDAGAPYGIPPTPPSSLTSDDSEGNLTPEHIFSPVSPNASVSASVATNGGTKVSKSALIARRSSGTRYIVSHIATTGSPTTRQPIHTPLISSQPKGSTGMLLLTEEEKRTLLAEGYPIPQKLPLTKAEEKSLKKIRRKIKNKISAQESRRKKKEYMDQLERRVENLVSENHDCQKRIEILEETNANLISQLHKLQVLVSKQNLKKF